MLLVLQNQAGNKNGKEIKKSWLVAKIFRQVYGLSYNKTYAPVVRLSALRELLSVSTNLRMHINVMGVENAFPIIELEHVFSCLYSKDS